MTTKFEDDMIIGRSRTNTPDTAVTLDGADGYGLVLISSTGAGTHTITRGTLPVAVPVTIAMTAHATNDYTCALAGGLTLTFSAANQTATVVWDGSALRPVGAPQGAAIA